MTTFFISRHPGAVEWALEEGYAVDEALVHLDASRIQTGDQVLGTLPVHLVAQVCAQGGQYFHLTLELPAELRGQELSAPDMRRCGARLEAYDVRKVKVDD